MKQDVLKLMSDGKARHLIDIAKHLGVKEPQNINITDLVRQGKLERVKSGTYQMPEKWRQTKAYRATEHGKD